MDIETLHHVSLPVTDLDRAKRFYGEILGLEEIGRPPFDFPGAWYAVGAGQLHLIGGGGATFRAGKRVDSRDIHFAVRVKSYRAALDFLRSQGYDENGEDLLEMKANPRTTAGFPQIYILDPDRNVIEINAATIE